VELLLWRWSTAVQISSAVMIAVFFVALARTDLRVELRWWRRAWLINVAALTVTIFYWYVEPPDSWRPIVRGMYLAGKTTFLLMLLHGALALLRPGAELLTRAQYVATAVFAMAAGAFVLTSVDLVGVGQQGLIAVLLGVGGAMLAVSGEASLRWLAAGMGIRATLALVETFVYLSQVTPFLSPPSGDGWRTFLSMHSSLDTGAEWLLALGCVLAVTTRQQNELREYNTRLLAAQDDLRKLVDHDPLTGLHNRRSLQTMLRTAQPKGATLLFFDLDNFKAINDLHGHDVGDECLKQFAAALRECFRPDDDVVRYAGDEFLVVAVGLDRAAVEERVAQVRRRMQRAAGQIPQFEFSVGVGELPAGGRPEAALQAADAAMYRQKSGPHRTAVSA
jgi:diguanylate cyclase (GGDEF)-like protein